MSAPAAPAPPPGVHHIRVPTPFAIGDVNAFLVEGDPLTLVDSGPNSASSLLALERGLERAGYAVADLGLLLVTHQHGDHLGLTEMLVERSGAEVGCLAALAPYVRDFKAAAGSDDDLAAELMLVHGVDDGTVRTLREFTRIIRGWGASFEVTRPLAPDEVVDIGTRRLRVLPRPGHSVSDTLFADEQGVFAFGGDHLLARTSSNALISQPLGSTAGVSAADRPRSLVTYIASLEATRALALELVLPGHGKAFSDPSGVIDRRLAFYEERVARIREILATGPRSAHAIAREIWGDVASSQAYLTTCEVLGHLDLLIARGLAEEDESGVVTVFRAAGGEV